MTSMNGQIFLNNGSRKHLLDLIPIKSKILIISSPRGKDQIYKDNFLKKILKRSSIIFYENFSQNPSFEEIKNAFEVLNNDVDIILAYGGGSVIDFAKCLKFSLANPSLEGNLFDYLNYNRDNTIIKNSSIKLFTVPTTAGTGSEVTNFASIWDKKNKKKYSLLHDSLYPDVSIIDPELTISLPLSHTISTGLDAINQAFESLWNKNANQETKILAYESIALGFRALPKLIENSENLSARYSMCKSSHLAGLCINKTRTAICHSISYPITAHYDVPHGIACAFSMEAVIKLVKDQDKDLYQEIEKNIDMGDLINKLKSLNRVTKFTTYCKSKVKKIERLIKISDEMFTPERADNFILPVNRELIIHILEESWKQ